MKTRELLMSLAVGSALMLAPLAAATGAPTAAGPSRVELRTQDVRGAAVAVPADGRPSIIVFARAAQAQSTEALRHVQEVAQQVSTAQVIVVFSGPQAVAQAREAAGTLTWPVVADVEYITSGRLNVHVWPTILVVRGDGAQVAHLPGLPSSLSRDLAAYASHAAGEIDDATLQQRLTANGVVGSTDGERAGRHLQVAMRLLERGRAEEAGREIDAGLALKPDDPALQIGQARVQLALSRPAEALASLDRIPAGALPAWQPAVVRMRALIALERWDEAGALAPDAMQLNPNPAEAHYLAGLVHQQSGQWQPAAESFRRAYEAASGGR